MTRAQILIVEDDRVVAEDVQISLERLGFAAPWIAVSGEEAIDKVRENRPDLVLMDIVLKGKMDGIEAGNNIRNQFNIPVVFLTAHADEKVLERAKITEPFGFIIKPFVDKELRTTIEIALYKHNVDEKLKRSQEQLRDLTIYLQSVREQERISIAREIHDDLGQLLTALKMDLSWLEKRLTRDQKTLIDKTKSMEEIINMMIRTVRRISIDLRPSVLDDFGLTAAIRWQSEQLQNRTGIKCRLQIDPEEIILDQDRSTALFRIFQETLTNIARHANATNVDIRLKQEAGEILLKVSDNGKGITERQIWHPKSFGLMGMRERAHVLGGEVKIDRNHDKGTTVAVSMPIEKVTKVRSD